MNEGYQDSAEIVPNEQGVEDLNTDTSAETQRPLEPVNFSMEDGAKTHWTFNNKPLPPEALKFSPEAVMSQLGFVAEKNAGNGQEGTVAPEEGQEMLVKEEEFQIAEAFAVRLNQEKGTTYTAEDLLSNVPEAMSLVSDLVENNPKIRKFLNVLMITTALGGGAAVHQEAKADMVGNVVTTVVRGVVRQDNVAAQQQINQDRMRDNQAIQMQQSQRHAQQAEQDLLNRQQMQREDLEHRRRMENITDRHAREDAELSYRQGKEYKRAMLNAQRQQATQNARAQNQEVRMMAQQEYQQQQIGVNTRNRVVQHVATGFLQSVLAGR